jgi:hypothetical protein
MRSVRFACSVKAVNAADLEGLVCCFAEDALVNDQLSEYSGKREIVDWAMRNIIAERGLPEPLVLNFYVTIFDTKIVQLVMLRNQNYL